LIALPEKLVILDYSGTLSRGAVLFARPEDLMKHLEDSGFKDLGIVKPEKYWEDLVNPTWLEGSTKDRGYKKVLEERLNAILIQNSSIAPHTTIADAVSLFVETYFKYSRIDKSWAPILYKLNQCPLIRTIIATDHYAEATDFIIHFLEELQIHAIPAKEDDMLSQRASFIIANSADMGFHKADRRFWEILKSSPKMEKIRHILIIDDFGYNEQKGDCYGDFPNVIMRRENTVSILKSLFSAEIEVFPFMIYNRQLSNNKIYGNLVRSAAARIESYLS
jgi:hypothetical protein